MRNPSFFCDCRLFKRRGPDHRGPAEDHHGALAGLVEGELHFAAAAFDPLAAHLAALDDAPILAHGDLTAIDGLAHARIQVAKDQGAPGAQLYGVAAIDIFQ